MYAIYRPRINSAADREDLKKVLVGLLSGLKDTHTTIYPQNSPAIQYYPEYPHNFYGIDWVKEKYKAEYRGNSSITYGLISSDIGYIYISSFSNQSSQYSIIDDILRSFRGARAIIIDVRGNTGGNSDNSEIIAGRFADQRRIYEYVKFRVSADRNEMGDFIPESISPAGQFQFLNKVAILTNRYSYSATENFALMMKSFPHVIHLGDFTGGGSETRPIFKELPGGWYYRVSSKLLCDLNKQPISEGVVPDILVQTEKSDSLEGKDSIIERAIEELKM